MWAKGKFELRKLRPRSPRTSLQNGAKRWVDHILIKSARQLVSFREEEPLNLRRRQLLIRTLRSDLCAVLRSAAARKLVRVAIDRKICAIPKIENRHHPLAKL